MSSAHSCNADFASLSVSHADIAFAVTSNNTTATNMYNLFQDKLKDARFIDSTEGQNVEQDLGMTDVIDAGTFINSRF